MKKIWSIQIFFVILPKNYRFYVMSTIQIKDKRFRISIPEAEIKNRVKAVAQQISKDMEGKNPLFLGLPCEFRSSSG